jgi:hypothetical protein
MIFMASLIDKNEIGRYVMMDFIDQHIPELNHKLVESARKAGADMH